MININHYRVFEMNALLFCQDDAFLETMNRVLNRMGLLTEVTVDYNHALTLLGNKRIDAVVIDWQEIINLGEFLESIQNSRMNKASVRAVIASDLRDMTDAFSIGVQFLIHKPASVVQISRCLEAMQAAILKQRRKSHREPVRISVALRAQNLPLLGEMIVNIGNEGLSLLLNTRTCKVSAALTVGSEMEFAFTLPETRRVIRGTGLIMWINQDGNVGVQFQYISDADKQSLEDWVGERFDRSVARLRGSMKAGRA